jgi:hypothetical protein
MIIDVIFLVPALFFRNLSFWHCLKWLFCRLSPFNLENDCNNS